MSSLLLLFSLLLYLGLLFLVALFGEGRGRALARNPWTYALSLAVYATAWTFFGSVGRAATEGATFLPVYLGPTLVLLLWPFLHGRLLELSRAHRLTSWADYLFLRYGHAPLASLAAAFLAVGLLPYLALQLKAIAQAFLFLSGERAPLADVAFLTALLLAFFAILFGTRRLDPSERHEGLVLAVAFESSVKLLALLLVGLAALLLLGNPFAEVQKRPELWPLLLPPEGLGGYLDWVGLTVLSGLAFLFLPRQFHVSVVENADPKHLPLAAWAFPLYLLLINLPILPLALLGRIHLPETHPDLFVLALAQEAGPALALLAFLGGVSAATAMVIVEALALSILVSNHLLSPLLLRARALGSLLLWRRLSILGILLLAYLYFRLAGEAYALVAMGLISFAAVAQLAPPALLGLFWKGATREGALAGLVGGILLWAYTLFLPALARSGWLPPVFLEGPHPLLRPEGLLGLGGLDPVTHGFLTSLLLNLGLTVGVSLFTQEAGRAERRTGEVGELARLLGRVLGPEAEAAFLKEAQDLPGLQAAARAEALLTGAVGPATARLLLLSVTEKAPPEALLEEAARESKEVRAYAKALEEARRELAQAYERLKALDQAKDEVLAAVSHELKTPLTAVRALAEILEAHPDLPEEERRRFTGLLAKEATRLSRLVEEVLAYAKLQAGLPLKLQSLDLRDPAQEALALVAPLARERGVALEARLPQEEVRTLTDRDRVLQVLLNLLQNALRHAHSRVILELEPSGKEAFFYVQDDGPGVPEEKMPWVFEPFQSFSGGTGLGLYLARRLAEALGGRVFLETGQGARFAFTLPLEVEHADSGGGRRGEHPGAPGVPPEEGGA
ncbi:ATP-binding protein [Thermus sp.]